MALRPNRALYRAHLVHYRRFFAYTSVPKPGPESGLKNGQVPETKEPRGKLRNFRGDRFSFFIDGKNPLKPTL
jgi:hypothetical protein